MNDPYPLEEESFWKKYYKYFCRLCSHVKNISFRGKQASCLVYLAVHPASSAYDIKPGRRSNYSSYKWARLALKQLCKLKLVKIVQTQQISEKHRSTRYLLTDEGILYLLNSTKLPYSMLMQDLFKNYHESNIFQYLVYPFMKLETLCSQKMKLNILAGVGNYLVSTLQKMGHTLELFEKEDSLDKKIYTWNYDKLEEYIRKKYKCHYLDLRYSKEDYDDAHEEITYFDIEDDGKDVKIIFDKKNKKGYVHLRNKRIKKYENPLIINFLNKKTVSHDEYVAGYFEAFCSPRTEEFVLLAVQKYFIDTTDEDIREILSNDKCFVEALKEFKNSFDLKFRRIMS